MRGVKSLAIDQAQCKIWHSAKPIFSKEPLVIIEFESITGGRSPGGKGTRRRRKHRSNRTTERCFISPGCGAGGELPRGRYDYPNSAAVEPTATIVWGQCPDKHDSG